MIRRSFFVLLFVASGFVQAQTHSALWGVSGELYDPYGRLPDFSYAGYRFGDTPIPDVSPASSVTDFGADGSDDLDDTEAFRAAIEATESGAILIPAGRFIISDILWIEKPGIVLRGDGSDRTVLHITKALEDVRPNMGATTSGQATSNYSWSGGFIWVRGGYESTARLAISEPARRGDRSVRVEHPEGLKPGGRVLIEQRDDEQGTLMKHLYGGDPGDTRKLTRTLETRFLARVESIEGQVVTLNRPLRWDVRGEWSPTIREFSPRVHDVGVESLAIEFDAVPYGGHFSELGRNAIAFNGTSDCWIRDVRTLNCDSSIFFTGMHGSIDGLVVESDRKLHGNARGHHGVTLGLDNLLTNFEFRTHYIHDITMTRLSAGNVIKNGSGVNLSLDHHKRANHANLYCNLDAGDGGDLWRCGGGASLGKHAGAWTTFWGIETRRAVSWPRASFGPDMMNLVGLHSSEAESKSEAGKWFEVVEPQQLEPRDLHAAQLKRRKAQSVD